MEAWILAGQLPDRDLRTIKIGGDYCWREPQHHAVAVAVDGHFVAFSTNPLGQLGEGANLLADEEEGCLHVGRCEQVENGRRAFWVRAVVESQRDTLGAFAAAWHADRLRQ
jgi:hypothetical protein